MSKVKTIYDLDLHECLWIESNRTEVQRVPGGWIYEKIEGGEYPTAVSKVFVPYNNEFQNKPPFHEQS